jgi:hypothetical protein
MGSINIKVKIINIIIKGEETETRRMTCPKEHSS